MKSSAALRAIPAVEKILQALGDTGLPRPAVVALVRREVAALRSGKPVPDFQALVERLRSAREVLRRPGIQPVINGTGILVQTNLGRGPLGPAVVETLAAIAANYNNLEFDLGSGERGSRATYLETNLALLCGAEAATVVNNCAAALVLILRPLAAPPRDEVVISRGELVQIGGGFRIPDILETSGAKLREVGTTNRTSVDDYARAIRRETGLILKVHRSNFFMGGFVETAGTEEIAALAKKKRIPLVEDLGSGAVVATDKIAGVEHEPTPAEVLRRGVDLVCFSGDKMFGGPQAGIIAGKSRLIAALKREPLFRALRCDKLSLAALQATVDLHLNQRTGEIPTLALLQISEDELRARAAAICDQLAKRCSKLQIASGRGTAKTGGGTLPKSNLPSVTIDIVTKNSLLADFASTLRAWNPPVIGYIAS